MTNFLSDYWSDLSALFSNSQQRLYWGYLLSALLIGSAYQLLQPASAKNSSRSKWHFISPRCWFSLSSRADYKVLAINKVIFLSLLPIMLTKLGIATVLFEQLHLLLPSRPALLPEAPQWLIVSFFTLFIFIFDDFLRFYLHRLMHLWPWLWAFHKVHHSATDLTPLTVLRTHPVEGFIFALRSALVQGISIALFVFFFAERVDVYTVLNVNILLFTFNLFGANLRHSHVPIRYWRWLESIIISPAQHQIHHSTNRAHFDRNFGAVIALWDKMSGSLLYSAENPVKNFGLSDTQSPQSQHLKNLYLTPFQESANTLRKTAQMKKKALAKLF